MSSVRLLRIVSPRRRQTKQSHRCNIHHVPRNCVCLSFFFLLYCGNKPTPGRNPHATHDAATLSRATCSSLSLIAQPISWRLLLRPLAARVGSPNSRLTALSSSRILYRPRTALNFASRVLPGWKSSLTVSIEVTGPPGHDTISLME